MTLIFSNKKLFTPGPTTTSEEAIRCMSDPNIYHRSPEFYESFTNCRTLLAPFFGSARHPYLFTSSGTGAMEAAVTNFTDEGDEVIAVVGGKFGDRWAEISSNYKCLTTRLEVTAGTSPSAEQISNLLAQRPNTRALLIQASETSTGAFYPIEKIVKEIRPRFKGLIMVDAISALCAHEIKMDEWGLDVVIAGSQKGLGIPPGLAFIAFSEKAEHQMSQRPRFYFDLRREMGGQEAGKSAFTPAAGLIVGLEQTLRQLNEYGVSRVIDHHKQLTDATRAGIESMGLELFVKDSFSHAVTSFLPPKEVSATDLLQEMKKQDQVIFSGGQDDLKGKILRMGHLGFMSRLELLTGLCALEFALQKTGAPTTLGQGVTRAMGILKSQ